MRLSTAVFTTLATVLAFSAAKADETGIASIHSWRHVGSKICFSDHSHDGGGTGASQKAAMRSAIHSWQDFTALEYGSDWASYGNSVGKSANCSQEGSGFNCHISATPCRSGHHRD